MKTGRKCVTVLLSFNNLDGGLGIAEDFIVLFKKPISYNFVKQLVFIFMFSRGRN